MSAKERIVRGVKAMMAANLVDVLSNAVLIIVLTRFLMTPEEFGELNFALSVFAIIAIFATLGLPKSTARYVTDYYESDPSQLRYLLRRSLLYLGALTLGVCLGIVALGRPVLRMVGESSLVPFLLVGALYVASRSFSSLFSAVFQGYNRVTWSAALSSITGVVRLVAVVGMILLGYGAVGAFFGYALSFAAAAIGGAIALYAGYYVHHDPTDEPAQGLSRRLLEYSVPLTATRGANVLDKKMDTVLVGLLLNMTAVSYYTVAKQISDFVSLPASSFGYTISPALGEQKAGNRLDRASHIYEESLKYVVVAYIPAMVGLVLVAEPTVRLVFGTDYLAAVPVVQVFSGFMFVNAVNKVTSDGLDYLGRARSRAVVKSLTAASNFVLNLLLIPVIGVVGAALATVITYSVYTGTNVYIIHSELDIRLRRVLKNLALTCLITVGMTAVVVFARPYISDLISLFAVVALGGGVWAILLLLSGLVDPAELADVVT